MNFQGKAGRFFNQLFCKAIANAVITAVVVSVTGCNDKTHNVKEIAEAAFGVPEKEALADVSVFVADSEYSQVIEQCVRVQRVNESCSLNRLPLIGMERENPDVDYIMKRVVVSHHWMGIRFQEVLQNLPAEMLALFKGVTAVVIDDDIRPSYFTTLSGAIYLDPAFLWLSNYEKATIDKEEDYRTAYIKQLAFRSLWRYTRNNDYAYQQYSLYGQQERLLEEIMLPVSALLLHELAHANDFFPPAEAPLLSDELTAVEAAQQLEPYRISKQLAEFRSLGSGEWKKLASILYAGSRATDKERRIDAVQAGEFFESDSASDDYSYTSVYEDTAMLFEEAMMKYFYHVDRDIAFTSDPEGSNDCDRYIVGWGVRNRLGDYAVRDRAQFVTDRLLPDLSLSLYYQELGYPVAMQPGASWCENLSLLPTVSSQEQSGPNLRVRTTPIVQQSEWLRHH